MQKKLQILTMKVRFGYSRGKNCFTHSTTRIVEVEAWLLLTFSKVTQSIKLYTFHYHILRAQMFETGDLSNTQKMSDYSFQHFLEQNLNSFLSLQKKTVCFKSFILKPTQSNRYFQTNATRDFQNSFFPFRNPHVFMWKSLPIFIVLNSLALAKIFHKTKIYFKKQEYRFLVESIKIENITSIQNHLSRSKK